ncbi:hypothetical protein RN001_004805 [Aquatica leii]|uniref:RING-type E3 ubiquitin transferase n=1 Tax=Aquatica leii TaxID=1421715 RepID=A0AAN7PF44_9COLE|nr:hypothetical protein RN001_004805 [Aquatica leii]
MWKFPVPDQVLDKLRCSLCKEYLSQLPVYIYPGQEGIACGRCPVLTEQNPIRDVTYETLASYLHFPCRFRAYGCLENVLLSRMGAHEESCTYKQYYCPFIPLASCPWQGPSSELFSHYEEHHSELALYEPTFEVDLINMYENNYILRKDTETFIIHAKCDSNENRFWCSLRYIGDKNIAKQFAYQVRLNNNSSAETITLSKKVVEDDTCMTLDKSTAVYIKSGDVTKALGNPCSVLCTINVLPNDINIIDPTDLQDKLITTKIGSDGVDSDMLMELECPVCNEYMVPPIYQCVTGHSICEICKTQVSNCPSCRENILETRNFSLENLTRFIKYHCKYRDFDCTYVSSSSEIKNHESSCKYGPYDCPFDKFNNCKWKGKLVDVMNHVQAAHEDNVLDNDFITWPFETEYSDENDENFYVINAHGGVFRLIFKYEGKVFYWSLQYVGPNDEVENYMYELDICDNSQSNQRMYMRKKCSRLLSYEETFNNTLTYIKIPLDLISPLIEDCLVYKCRIIKVQ